MSLSHKIGRVENLLYRHYRAAHGVRIGLAFVITLMFIRLTRLPEGSWPLITLVVLLGPMSFWGNVKQRSIHRIIGTCLGATSGIIALYIELYSQSLMLIWCAVVMFCAGYLALGKRPYVALLIGITLAVVASAEPGDMHTALWRAGDVILGAIMALALSSIYPQRAFIHWRLQMSDSLTELARIYGAYTSMNLLERPNLNSQLSQELHRIIKMRTFIKAASRETHMPLKHFDQLQTVCRDLISTFELLIESHWASRDGRFWMINASLLRQTRGEISNQLHYLAQLLLEGSQYSPTDELLNKEKIEALNHQLEAYVPSTEHLDQQTIVSIYGYIWLTRKMGEQIQALENLLNTALKK